MMPCAWRYLINYMEHEVRRIEMSDQGTQPGTGSASSKASTMFGTATIEPHQMERLGILWLKIIAWTALVAAVLGACATCGVGIMSSNVYDSITTSSLANLQRVNTVLNSLGMLLTGVAAWAVFLVLASIADSLIMIRRNTSRQ